MAGEFVRLTDVSEIITKGTTPTSLGRPFVESGVNYIKSESITSDGRIDRTKFAYIDEATHNILKRSRLQEGDILFSMAGVYLGKTAVVADEVLPANTNQAVGIIRLRKASAVPRFVHYALSSPDCRALVRRSVAQSAQPNFNLADIGRLLIPALCLREQAAIAHILGTLDDKIELNRRMAETLEAMTEALFKSWFVDFDPVRAKAKGRDPNLPKTFADLFPVRMVDSEVDEIPEGWNVKPLSTCVDVARGLSYKGAGLSLDGVPMHNLNSIYEGGGYKHDGLKYYDGDFKPQHVAHAGDVIVANTEQGHKRLLIGYAAIVPARFGETSLFSHHIYRVRPKNSSPMTADYVCHLLNTRVMHDIVSGYANGTTVNMLAMDGLESPVVVVPPANIISAFTDLAQQARLRCEGLVEESQTLAALRDTLLPKLISGQLRIKDAEHFLECAGV